MKRVFFLAILLITSSACAPYFEQSRPALEAYDRGKFKEAAELSESIKPRGADRLLALLDKGAIQHSAGNYDKSIKFFSKAEGLAERYAKEPVSAQVGAVFANDNILPYVADTFERLLIHMYQILNYSALGQFNEALVEARRIDTLFPNIYSEKEKRNFLKSPFLAYLSGLVWEENRLCNDAYIDYRKVEKMKRRPARINGDVRRAYECSGLSDPARGDTNEKASARPNLIVVFEAGKSPVKVSSERNADLQVIPVPLYEDRPSRVSHARVIIDGRDLGGTEELEDVGTALKLALEKKMPAIIARALARLAVKESAAIAVGEKVDKDLGIMLGILSLATNRADLRSWRTLPDQFHIWVGALPAGTHSISLVFLDGEDRKAGSVSKEVGIKDGEMELLIFRSVE